MWLPQHLNLILFLKELKKRDIDVHECQCQRKFSVMNVSEIFIMS